MFAWLTARFDRWMNGGKWLRKARGRNLDRLAYQLGIARKHYWWIFQEGDESLRARAIQGYLNRPSRFYLRGFSG